MKFEQSTKNVTYTNEESKTEENKEESPQKIPQTNKNDKGADGLKKITKNSPTCESKSDNGTPEKARSAIDMETSDAAKATSNEPPSGSPNVGESVGQSSSTKSTGSVSEESLSLRNLELPSLNSDAGQLEGRYSFETHFEFSNKELSFEKQCDEIIKEITRKDINDDNRPSFEQ